MIKPNFKMGDVHAYVLKQIAAQENAVLETYKFIGESFIVNARSKTSEQGGFRDVTGNLRSSIGYIIIKNGKQVYSGFDEAKSTSDKAVGKSEGKSLALEVAAKYPTSIALICVAGMNYAAAVESRGKDVITGSTFRIEAQLRNLLKNVQ